MMIEPTVGRIVWYYEHKNQDQLMAAIVSYVHSNMQINLCVIDRIGFTSGLRDILLLQTDADYKGSYPYATWMPYQRGQAAKTEALEKELKK